MPLIGIRNELQNDQLQILPLNELPIETMWSLTWLKGKKHSPVAKAFLDYVQREKDVIIQRRFEWYEQY